MSEHERLAKSLDGYASAYDNRHRDIADDFRKAATIVRQFAALNPVSPTPQLTDEGLEEHVSILQHWLESTPVYEGDDPRAAHYRRNRAALAAAIAALQSHTSAAVEAERGRILQSGVED